MTAKLLPLLMVLGLVNSSQSQSPNAHERLRVRNTFATPAEVVSYYVGRDASGFVWSGLLDVERRAFTTWDRAPEADSFIVAKGFEIQPTEASRKDPNQATVEVRYDVVGVGDGHGTRMPVKNPVRTVRFVLQRVSGQWKIARPLPGDLAPVVLESKFPTVAAQGAKPAMGERGEASHTP